MATDPSAEHSSSGVDPGESPFELQAVEGLPLTKAEKAELERVLQQYDRERAAGSES